MLRVLLLLGMLVSSVAYAEEKQQPVTVEMQVYQVVQDKQGVEKRVAAEQAKPDDLLEYVALYENHTQQAIQGLNATLPIPEGVVFVAASERPRGALASVDGLHFEAMPLKKRMQQADGTWKEVLIPLASYRFLRWNFQQLDAKKKQAVSARVRLLTE